MFSSLLQSRAKTSVRRPVKLQLGYSSAQSIGTRDTQEDRVFCSYLQASDPHTGDEPMLLSLVADGMGGHVGGEIASKLATNCFVHHVGTSRSTSIKPLMQSALTAANSCLQQFVSANQDYLGMGTTLLATLIQGDQMFYISVGDSRLYLARDNSIQLLNTLHNYSTAEQALRSSVPNSNWSENRSSSHILSSCLNGNTITATDSNRTAIQLQPADRLLLATDGIESLTAQEIHALLYAATDTDKSASQPSNINTTSNAQSVINWVKQKPALHQDNTSVVVIAAD